MFHYYTPWKRQKTSGFLAFLWGIEMEQLLKMVYEMIEIFWRKI